MFAFSKSSKYISRETLKRLVVACTTSRFNVMDDQFYSSSISPSCNSVLRLVGASGKLLDLNGVPAPTI